MSKEIAMSNDTSLPPEPQEGNVEYKLKLVNISDIRIEHLTTQMLWRLEEGNGEAIYQIGVEDCGNLKGLSHSELDYSLRTVTRMAESLNAKIVSLQKIRTPSGNWAAKVVVRRLPQVISRPEVRLAMVGAVEAGKSTLLGVLSSGILDNGCGLSRLNLFRHPHEVQTGRTSSMSFEVLGFDEDGQVINYGQTPCNEVERSTSVVTMVDLAGCSKYFKTTVNGLLGFSTHFAALTISAATGPVAATYEHFALARALDISVFTVVTKSDLVSTDNSVAYYTEKIINPLLQSCQSIGFDLEFQLINSADEAVNVAKALSNGSSKTLMPVFTLSSVSGNGIGLLTQFLNALEPRKLDEIASNLGDSNSVFYVREVFNIPSVGTVVGGVLTSGVLTVEQVVRVGPDSEGKYSLAKIRSLHWSRNPVEVVRPGQYAAICLDFDEPSKALHLKRGSVLLSLSVEAQAIHRFSAKIRPLNSFGINQSMVQVESITAPVAVQLHRGGYCQTVACLRIEKVGTADYSNENTNPWLSPNSYSCDIDFVERPGFIEVGDRFFLRRHAFRAVGIVQEVYNGAQHSGELDALNIQPEDDADLLQSSPTTEEPVARE